MGDAKFVPFGEFKPDLRYFGNDGLLRAKNVVPVHGDYVSSPAAEEIAEIVADGQEFGLHVHRVTGDGYAAVNVPGAPAAVHLYQVTEAGVVTDRSRVALYSNINDFSGCSFGPYVVMTNYDDEVQFRDGGGAALFANAITSTFAPKAKFCFPLRTNVFLANCNLPGAYDGLAAGANPTLVAWSRNDDLRQFGSFNANPEIIGSGFQPLNYDIGDITGAVGCDDYAIVGFSDGLVRVDGPPYSFRVLSSEHGTIHPYSLLRAKGSVWFWGPSGLTVISGGDSVPQVVGLGKFTRSLIDNTTGSFEAPWEGSARISMAYDSVNDLIFAAYRSPLSANGWAQTYITYNITEDRAAYSLSPVVVGVDHRPIHFLRTGRQGQTGAAWCPGSAIRFLSNTGAPCSYYKLALGQLPSVNAPLLQRGYMQFNPDYTTRIARIRPVYSVTDQAAIEKLSVTIESTNKPYATPTVSEAFSSIDTNGWITTPSTVFADFHSIRFDMQVNANMHKVVEYFGFEYEAIDGPKYGG